jgi:hypothetical protein
MRHDPIFDEIMERYNPIAAFSAGNTALPHSGTIVAHTRTGVGQGDPWGGLFFELGYQTALLQLSQHVRNEAAAFKTSRIPFNHCAWSGHVIAYEDDTQVMGPTTLVFRIASSIAPILAAHGFYMNIDKSYITGYCTPSSSSSDIATIR